MPGSRRAEAGAAEPVLEHVERLAGRVQRVDAARLDARAVAVAPLVVGAPERGAGLVVGAAEPGVLRVPQLEHPPLLMVWSGSGFGPLIAPMPMPVCADAIGAAHPHAAMTIAAIHVRRLVPMAQADQAGLTKH